MDRDSWNAFVAANGPKSGSFLQSWDWGEYQAKLGFRVVRLECEDGDDEALVQAVVRPLPLGLATLYVGRGPLATSDSARAAIISELKRQATELKVAALRIDPAQALTLSGASRTKPLQPQTTLLLDLERREDELLAAMHKKTRYNIRLAEKKGVTVREGGSDLFLDFWRLLRSAAKRDGFGTHPEAHYAKLIDNLSRNPADRSRCSARILLAEHGGDPLAAMILVTFADAAIYLHGGSSDLKRNLMAPYLLHWEAIRRAKAWGYQTYDFWGVAPEGAERHPLAGVSRFKRGFGGKLWQAPDPLELPISRGRYTIYALAQKLRGR